MLAGCSAALKCEQHLLLTIQFCLSCKSMRSLLPINLSFYLFMDVTFTLLSLSFSAALYTHPHTHIYIHTHIHTYTHTHTTLTHIHKHTPRLLLEPTGCTKLGLFFKLIEGAPPTQRHRPLLRRHWYNDQKPLAPVKLPTAYATTDHELLFADIRFEPNKAPNKKQKTEKSKVWKQDIANCETKQ